MPPHVFWQVHVVASLPCYSPKNVNMQRGSGVFDRSIRGLMKLNALGYGKPDSGLKLDLVYNPVGGFLSPEQVRIGAPPSSASRTGSTCAGFTREPPPTPNATIGCSPLKMRLLYCGTCLQRHVYLLVNLPCQRISASRAGENKCIALNLFVFGVRTMDIFLVFLVAGEMGWYVIPQPVVRFPCVLVLRCTYHLAARSTIPLRAGTALHVSFCCFV